MARISQIMNLAVVFVALTTLFAPPLEAQDIAREGIAVHGDWVIEVRNPDGSVSERREFSNDLGPYGDSFLVLSLSPATNLVLDRILLGPCAESPLGNGVLNPCYLDATDNTLVPAQAGFTNLPRALVLEGSHVVSLPTLGTTSLSRVATVATACPVGTNPCGQGEPGAYPEPLIFTETTLATPVEIADGQTVLVTVTISFN